MLEPSGVWRLMRTAIALWCDRDEMWRWRVVWGGRVLAHGHSHSRRLAALQAGAAADKAERAAPPAVSH